MPSAAVSVPAAGTAVAASGLAKLRDKAYARLEQMPFGRGLALLGGMAATVIVLGGMGTALGRGSGPATPVPEVVQSTSRTPAGAADPGTRSPAPTRPTPPQRAFSATRTFRVPAAAPPSRPPSPRQTDPALRSPIWRHDPSQWGDRPWFWRWWGGGDRERR